MERARLGKLLNRALNHSHHDGGSLDGGGRPRSGSASPIGQALERHLAGRSQRHNERRRAGRLHYTDGPGGGYGLWPTTQPSSGEAKGKPIAAGLLTIATASAFGDDASPQGELSESNSLSL